MVLSVYKSGQGYWTRMLSAIGGGTLVLAGIAWLLPQFDALGEKARIVQAIVSLAILATFGLLGWFLLNKPRIVDFLVATEAEMRKVNWPNRSEIVGSTWIVICGTIIMAVLLFAVDLLFIWFFSRIGILG